MALSELRGARTPVRRDPQRSSGTAESLWDVWYVFLQRLCPADILLCLARYQTRTGKKRPCDYIEDDEYHRQRIESGRRTRSPPPESAASPSTVNSNLEAKDNGFQATSSSKASTSSDSSAESPRPRSSDDTKVSVTPAKTALEVSGTSGSRSWTQLIVLCDLSASAVDAARQ